MKTSMILASAIAALSCMPTYSYADADNVVLVHGVAVDGSTWRQVYDGLVEQGLNVRVVQLPMEGFDADVAAARRIVESLEGTTVLVGHSYGGSVITELGAEDSVSALVYVAALQPDVGESLASLSALYPVEVHQMPAGADRFIPDPDYFLADIAADLLPEDVAFLAASAKPTPSTTFAEAVDHAAWHDKPSFALVASEDRTISPELQRYMYRRSGAKTVEVASSHMVIMSRPSEVIDLILEAVSSVD